jgi:hypothetical protein
MLVSLSHRDFTDTFGEAGALAKYLAAQRQQGTSELVRELSEGRPPGFGFTASPQEVETETLAALRSAKGILAEKSPGEADSYAQHVLGVMDAVAEAKGGVSAEESAAIERLKATLGS